MAVTSGLPGCVGRDADEATESTAGRSRDGTSSAVDQVVTNEATERKVGSVVVRETADGGETYERSFELAAGGQVETAEVAEMDADATVVVSVDGMKTADHDWTGEGGGDEMQLDVVIRAAEIRFYVGAV